MKSKNIGVKILIIIVAGLLGPTRRILRLGQAHPG
jgi:hypothetical protein